MNKVDMLGLPAHLQLAHCLLAAAELHEESYDRAAAEEYTRHLPPGAFVDFQRFYGLSLEEAAHQACMDFAVPDLEDPTYLLLLSNWNDIIVWAEQVTGIHVKRKGER
jgi:hypothetical protein